jgi:hypothetical protein
VVNHLTVDDRVSLGIPWVVVVKVAITVSVIASLFFVLPATELYNQEDNANQNGANHDLEEDHSSASMCLKLAVVDIKDASQSLCDHITLSIVLISCPSPSEKEGRCALTETFLGTDERGVLPSDYAGQFFFYHVLLRSYALAILNVDVEWLPIEIEKEMRHFFTRRCELECRTAFGVSLTGLHYTFQAISESCDDLLFTRAEIGQLL